MSGEMYWKCDRCGELHEYELETVDDSDGLVLHGTIYVLAANDHDAGCWNGLTATPAEHDSVKLDSESGEVAGDWQVGTCKAEAGEQVCRVCGCMEGRLSEGCIDAGGCYWQEPDLCSACWEHLQEQKQEQEQKQRGAELVRKLSVG